MSQSNKIQQFMFDQSRQVRIVQDESGVPWFVAKDVCDVLEIVNSRDAVFNLDEDEKGVAKADTPGGPQEMITISESGLYTLIIRSNKPMAKPFRRWVTHEVLPAIRKHGVYVADEVAGGQAPGLDKESGPAPDSLGAWAARRLVFCPDLWVGTMDCYADYARWCRDKGMACHLGRNRFQAEMIRRFRVGKTRMRNMGTGRPGAHVFVGVGPAGVAASDPVEDAIGALVEVLTGLEQLIGMAGWARTRMAETVGYSNGFVQQVLDGRQPLVPFVVIEKMARALGYDVAAVVEFSRNVLPMGGK